MENICYNEIAELKEKDEITSGDISTVDIEFAFSSEWDGYKKTILFLEKEAVILFPDNRNA